MLSKSVIVAVGMTMCVAIAGCAAAPSGSGAGFERADSTSGTLEVVREEIAAAKPLVADMVARLNDLVNRPALDLRLQYREFVNAAEQAQRHEPRVSRAVDAMRAERDEYMVRWQSDVDEITSEGLQARAVSRMADTNDRFAELDVELDTMSLDFAQLLADVADLRRYLSSDLTHAGLISVKDLVEQARTSARELQQSMDTAMDLLSRLSTDLAPSVIEDHVRATE